MRKVSSQAVITIWLLISALSQLQGQIPIDNPYKKSGHWTNNLKWANVTSAKLVKGLIDTSNRVDSLRLQIVLDSISQKGGGVLYFPKGSYFFNFNLLLADGVIIRGADPIGITNAQLEGYSPLTRLEFPKYEPKFSGNGTPNSTAFKKIYAPITGVKNFGLVNVDINRGRIEFHAYLTESEKEQVQNKIRLFPKQYHENILIFGIRQNNVAVPNPTIPTKFMLDERRGWQRWPLLDGANIDILVNRNCTIANCRLNDNITDNYDQPRYLVHSGLEVEGSHAKFKYDFHTAIWINIRAHSLTLFEGIEVVNNYVITSSYWDKIGVRGKDAIVENNVDNGIYFSNDLDVDDTGQWEVDLQWRKIADNDSIFKKKIYIENKSDTIPYRLLTPSTDRQKNLPLVIFLHGVGELGRDNSNQLKHLVYYFGTDKVRNKYPAYVIAPQFPDESSERTNPAAIIALSQSIIKEYPIDTKRIYLIGISRGGNSALRTVGLYPQTFASVVSVSAIFPFKEEEFKNFKKTSFSFYYGLNDPTTPPAYFAFMASHLRKYGAVVKTTGYEDAGHAIWRTIGEDDNFYEWLFSQSR